MLIYGANGYTGRLIAIEAVKRGLRPTLAGRNRQAITTLAASLECPATVFSLESTPQVAQELRLWREGSPNDARASHPVVLNCAGPFEKTTPVFMPACLQSQVSYLDITGEISVIERAAALKGAALESGITLAPAVGFDVVPSDCFAAALVRRSPGATHLQLAFAAGGPGANLSISHGTARTAWDNAGGGGMIRKAGRLEKVPVAYKVERIPFPSGMRQAMTIPWGDVASAYYSTGVGNIEVFMGMPKQLIQRLRRWRWLAPLAGVWPISALGRRWIERNIHGPTEEERAAGYAEFWGAAWKQADGGPNVGRVEGTMVTPEAYTLTVQTALDAAQRVESGKVSPGFQTASQLFEDEYLATLAGEGNLHIREV